MKEIGTIKMRKPDGGQSSITVWALPNGDVDIGISRGEEGDALLRLPFNAARRFSTLVQKAVAETEII